MPILALTFNSLSSCSTEKLLSLYRTHKRLHKYLGKLWENLRLYVTIETTFGIHARKSQNENSLLTFNTLSRIHQDYEAKPKNFVFTQGQDRPDASICHVLSSCLFNKTIPTIYYIKVMKPIIMRPAIL